MKTKANTNKAGTANTLCTLILPEPAAASTAQPGEGGTAARQGWLKSNTGGLSSINSTFQEKLGFNTLMRICLLPARLQGQHPKQKVLKRGTRTFEVEELS